MPETNREKELFEQAVELVLEERAAFLRRASMGDEKLLQRLLALLAANDAPEAFLPGKPKGLAANQPGGKGEGTGSFAGPYKLLEQIGEGGFGIVYMAEQFEPIRRRIALKVIKPGMDSRQVIGRFETERQALALMDHPNIARVLDAGATESGRPYFAMELVRGIPITRFCDEQKLDTEARLELFVDVCSAVQHAHQKGIIHRDLKPSNILVTLHGDRSVPKVIDFGIAKATQEPLTDKTVFTLFQQFLGTPAYMSPEQAALSGLDVDTRSDIYSLGVLLYELLAGDPPFDAKELLSAGLDEMRKTICEREPERPSTRRLRSSRSSTAASSFGAPQLSHELDLIVLKALEKDRDRRYATADALAEDLSRFLNHEPITAAAPGLAYQLGKFYHRNRPAVVTTLLVAIVLIAASVVSASLAVRARRAETAAIREAAAAQNVSEFLWKELLKPLTPWQHTNPAISLREAFDLAANQVDKRLEEQPLAEASIRLSLGRTYLGLSELAAAETNLLRALELRRTYLGQFHERTAEVLWHLGNLREFQLRPEDAEAMYAEASSIRARVLGPDDRDTVIASAKAVLIRAGRLPDAGTEPLLHRTIERLRPLLGEDHHLTRNAMNALGLLWSNGGKFDEAFDIFKDAQRLAAAADGGASSGALNGLALMAVTRARQGRLAEADQSFLELIPSYERANGTNHALTLATRMRHSDFVLVPQGRFSEAALVLLKTAVPVRESQPALESLLEQSLRSALAAWQAKGGGPEFEEFRRRANRYLAE